MPVEIKVKSRLGSSGAPSTLKTGEIAYNHINNIFYIGQGDAGGGVASSVVAIAGADFAKLASPALTGTPTVPTAAAGTDTTQIASTAFVQTSVTNALQGLSPKALVKAASTADLTLSGTQTVDGIALIADDRILVKEQTSSAENGIYIVAAGAWSRATDMDVWEEVPGAYCFVEQGTINADLGFVCTADTGGTLNTTAITFVQFTGAGTITAGAGLTKTGSTINVVTADSGRIVINADSIDLATTAVTPGTYQGMTVDAYGRVNAAVDQGYLAGSLGATDNAILRADGTGAKTGQGSSVTMADDGTISGAIIDGGSY